MINFTESDFAEVYKVSEHFREMTEERFLQDCNNLSDENGIELQRKGFKTFLQEYKKLDFLLDRKRSVNEESFIKRVINQNNKDKTVDTEHLIICIAHFLMGRIACKKAMEQYETRKKENRLPRKGITLENYLDLVINNENYEDSEAFLGVSGLISEKELTSKIDYVSEIAKRETQSNNQ